MAYSISHEISRMIFRFKRDGYLETIGPAGTNAMNLLYVLLALSVSSHY